MQGRKVPGVVCHRGPCVCGPSQHLCIAMCFSCGISLGVPVHVAGSECPKVIHAFAYLCPITFPPNIHLLPTSDLADEPSSLFGRYQCSYWKFGHKSLSTYLCVFDHVLSWIPPGTTLLLKLSFVCFHHPPPPPPQWHATSVTPLKRWAVSRSIFLSIFCRITSKLNVSPTWWNVILILRFELTKV